MQHVTEYNGVLLLVEYEKQVPVMLNSVRVLGPNYEAVGPELIPMFRNLASLEGTPRDGITDATWFLSLIAGEINEFSRKSQAGA